MAFEQRVVDVLSAIYGVAFEPAPTIRYRRHGVPQSAILDGLLRLPNETVVIEVKLRHTERVWEQLIERYGPLVRQLEAGRVRLVEICRSFDPAVAIPCRRITSLHEGHACVPAPEAQPRLEVLTWRI